MLKQTVKISMDLKEIGKKYLFNKVSVEESIITSIHPRITYCYPSNEIF